MTEATTLDAPIAGPGMAKRDHNLPSSEDLLVMVSQEPEVALTDPAIRDALIEALEAEVAGTPTDAKTEANRKAISAAKRRVSAFKTAIDKARLEKTAGLRDEVSRINAVGKDVDGKLQQLQDRIEAPLKAWKQAEDARLATIDRTFDTIKASTNAIHALPSSAIALRIEQVEALTFPADVFVEGTMAVEEAKAAALIHLAEAKAIAEDRERQAAELERLRAAEQERQAAEAERIAQEQRQRDADAAAARAVEAAREAERQQQQREVDEANRRAAEAEAAAQAERERIAEQQRAEERARQKAIDEENARKADREHRARVDAAAAAAIVELGVPEAKAKNIVLAIAAGTIPAVSIQY